MCSSVSQPATKMPAAERQREGTSAITAATASPATLHITHVSHVALTARWPRHVCERAVDKKPDRPTDKTDSQTAIVRKHAYVTCIDMLRALHVCVGRYIDRWGRGE